jgi:hypothetical protein
MKLTELECRFAAVGIVRGGIFLLRPLDAIRLIDESEKAGVPVLGAEGFRVIGEKIQPLQEHSIDLYGNENNSHAVLRRFVGDRSDLDIWFEVGIPESVRASPHPS